MESVILCSNCGYRHVDVVALAEKEPAKYTLKVETEEDLLARVVRSSYSTVKIPELGVEITPGSEGEGYISNVEGVLARVEDILITVKSWVGESKKVKKADELLERINRIKSGRESMHLIIEDSTGNSAIISHKAVKEKLNEIRRNKKN